MNRNRGLDIDRIAFFIALSFFFLSAPFALAQQSDLDARIAKELPEVISTYKSLHEAPELSHYEKNTSALIAARLRELGFTVTDHIGKYDHPGWAGYGLVGILKNGDGPTVLVRTELDALPVTEKTGGPSARGWPCRSAKTGGPIAGVSPRRPVGRSSPTSRS